MNTSTTCDILLATLLTLYKQFIRNVTNNNKSKTSYKMYTTNPNISH